MSIPIFDQFASGRVSTALGSKELGPVPWTPHPEFAGVFLKHLITGSEGGERFTCHLVRLEPWAVIGRHAHSDSVELHEVVDGRGSCLTEWGEIDYAPGCVAVMDCNSLHEVRAGERGLCLLAKFIRAC